MLVEASAGYKNFTGDDFDRQISNETEPDLMEDQMNRVSDVFMEGGSETVFTSSDEHDVKDESNGQTNGDDVFQDTEELVEEAEEARDQDQDGL